MNPSTELCYGGGSLITAGLCHLFADAFPVITFIGATCGAILAIHGVVRLVLHYFRGVDLFK